MLDVTLSEISTSYLLGKSTRGTSEIGAEMRNLIIIRRQRKVGRKLLLFDCGCGEGGGTGAGPEIGNLDVFPRATL